MLREPVHRPASERGQRWQDLFGDERRFARASAAATAAKDQGAPDASALEAKATELDGKVQTLFRGETLRGLLLTSYGFSEFGRKAEQAALVAFLVALVLFLASIAGIVHALRAPKNQIVQ